MERVPITVHDQDRNRPLLTRIVVDYSSDQTGFFGSTAARDIVQQAADDWSYLLDDMQLDAVPAMDESTFIWDPTGFETGHVVTNTNAYTGFLLYAYGISSSALIDGGEGSYQGKLASSGGAAVPLRRSGGVEVNIQGAYSTLGWLMDLDPDTWWRSSNSVSEQSDLYALVHVLIGHAHGFNAAYPWFADAKAAEGLNSPALQLYHGGPLAISSNDDFHGTIDPDSGFGAFGNEFHGAMPSHRWIITHMDVLALEAIGYKLRPLSFEHWQDAIPDCP
jgi:hypothetical protein